MYHEINKSGDQLALIISGQFTSKDRKTFLDLIPGLLDQGGKKLVLEMKDLSYMDSVGLGLLVTLRDEANKKGMETSISGVQGEVKNILEIACFDRLFSIS